MSRSTAPRTLRRSRPLLAALGLVLLSAAPSSAADGDASISYVESTAEGLQVLVSVPADVEVDLEGVTMSVDGADAGAEAALATSTTTVRRTTILTIDTSNSMRGERFEAAKTAAETFLETVPDDVFVGIVTFDSTVDQALPPSLDRDEAQSVIDGLELDAQTSLYDGVLAAVDMAGDEGQRSLLVLSDGADTTDTPLEDVTAAVNEGGTLVDVVALEQTGGAKRALEELASSGDGEVIDADPDALRDAFDERADVLARQVLVTGVVPESITASEASISVSLPTADTTLTASAFAPIRKSAKSQDEGPVGPAVPAAESDPLIPQNWMYAGLGGVFLGMLAVLMLLVPRKAEPISGVEAATTYTDRMVGRTGSTGTRKAEVEPLHQAKDAAAKVLTHNKSLENRIAARLEAAGSDLKPSEWLLLHTAIFVGAGVAGLLLGGGSLVLSILFVVLGVLGPWLFLGFKKSRRRKAFNSLLPDTLQLISGSLSAGLSLAQSVDTVVREGTEPISGEFKRVLIETRLGVSLEDAFSAVAERYDSKDFAWVVMAIKIQRQVGGNLAELLDTVAGTMREREYMRRQVAALAAEGKLSAYVLGGLPPAFMVYLLLTSRDYVMPLFGDPLGWMMLGGGAFWLGVGVFWMSRLVKVEV